MNVTKGHTDTFAITLNRICKDLNRRRGCIGETEATEEGEGLNDEQAMNHHTITSPG
jgi:hypothetical protein